jgi:hypothetical protein
MFGKCCEAEVDSFYFFYLLQNGRAEVDSFYFFFVFCKMAEVDSCHA